MVDRLAEYVVEMGRRVRGHDEGLVSLIRHVQRGRTGNGAFAHAAFSREENESLAIGWFQQIVAV